MEQRMPRVATVTKILSGLIVIGIIVNLQIDFFSSPGITIEEYIGFTLFLVTLVLAFYSSMEREVPTLGNQLTLEEQIAVMESAPTKTGSVQADTQQSSQTQNIISAIIGSKNEINQQQINSAIGTLSEGDIGLSSSTMAEEFPAPHRYSDDLNNYQNDSLSAINSESNNVPLPVNADSGSDNDDVFGADELSLSGQNPITHNEVNQIVAKDNEALEFSKIDDLPDLSEILGDFESNNQKHANEKLPELDDLFIDDNKKLVETPDLPDLDDMF